jgi:hypothetical protein
MKKIKSTQEFNSFCSSNQIVFKLPEESSQQYYLLLSICATEMETGLSSSTRKIDQNWELVSDYKDSSGEVIFVFEIWANKEPASSFISSFPGSVGYEHLGKKLEISISQIKRVIQQFVSFDDPQSIWYYQKIRNAKVLNKYLDQII